MRRHLPVPPRLALAGICIGSTTFTGPSAHAALVYGVTEQDILVSWDSSAPGEILSGVAIQDLNGQTIQGIDFRPATAELYAITSLGVLRKINVTTGQTTLLGVVDTPLNGSNFGFDFNPVVDLIRLTSNADQNMRINPNTGAVAGVDGGLFYASGLDPNVTHSAYTNSTFPGTASTTLYGIDTGNDQLVTQNPATGELTLVGGLGVNVAEDGGFDIFSTNGGGATNTAYAALRPTNLSVSNFYTINLTTGQATLIGEIGGGVNIRAMTVLIVPEPGSLALLGLGGLIVVRGRRRPNP